MIDLTSRQRKVLERYAQNLSPVVLIGQGGVTEAVTGQVDSLLASKELIKIKFNEFKEEKRELIEQLCKTCDASFVRIIGHVAVLYRPAKEADKRQYEKELSSC
jgi:RNA-binding protein